MRALITGITGFAGSFLAEYLLQNGDELMGCSRSARWGGGVPVELASDIALFSWDVSQPLTAAAHKEIEIFAPECIYHLAAMSTPSDCGGAEPNELAIATNVEGTRAVTELAMSLDPKPKVLFTSSCHVYGRVTTAAPIVSESTELAPHRAYGKTKFAAEKVFATAIQRGMPGMIARAFHHTGPRQSPRMVLPDWVRQFAATDGKPIRVQTMDANLDLSDVRDIVRAYRALMEKGQVGEAYNIGTGISRRSGDIFAQLSKMVDPDREVIEVSPQTVQQPIADISKLRSHTKWKPVYSLTDTLRDTLSFWQQKDD
ncbi:MAG: GDP-4-dehydro-6-deoxy-D-mannose reductase [Pirellulaceae bacterium]